MWRSIMRLFSKNKGSTNNENNETNKKRVKIFDIIFYVLAIAVIIYLSRGRVKQFFDDKKVQNINISSLTFTDIDNKNFSINEEEDKLVMLVFWASWCLPCRNEIPTLNKIYNSYPKDNLTLLSINTSDSLETIEKFKQKNNINYPIVVDKNYSNIFSVNILPTAVFIKNKKIVKITHGFDLLLENRVKKYIKNKKIFN